MATKWHVMQEGVFDIFIYVSYVLVILAWVNYSNTASIYLDWLNYYGKIYICVFLIWRFNPWRTQCQFTSLDCKIAYNAGLFMLTTTALNYYVKQITHKLIKIQHDILVLPTSEPASA